MKLDEIILITNNKVARLKEQRQQAVSAGDLVTVDSIDLQITETEITLNQLQTKTE